MLIKKGQYFKHRVFSTDTLTRTTLIGQTRYSTGHVIGIVPQILNRIKLITNHGAKVLNLEDNFIS